MPWCTGCDRFLSPSTVTAAGACPRCGGTVDPGRARSPESTPATSATPEPAPRATGPTPAPSEGSPAPNRADEDAPLPLPWHFKLLVAAIALYLVWRAVQGVDWVIRQL